MKQAQPLIQPYTRHVAYCPDCGESMAVTTRRSEQPTHDAPLTWSCVKCKKSWSVPAVRLAATAVDYDDGGR